MSFGGHGKAQSTLPWHESVTTGIKEWSKNRFSTKLQFFYVTHIFIVMSRLVF